MEDVRMTEHGIFYWNELMSRDVERSKSFYTETLGWVFSEMPMDDGGTYWVANIGDKAVGGMFEMNDARFEGVPEHWTPYVAVDDVDKRAALAVANGAEILRPAFDVPGVGRIVLLKDNGGASQGWMTPTPSDT